MTTADTRVLIDRFLQRFASEHAPAIRRMVEEARREAVAEAKAVIRHRVIGAAVAGQSGDERVSGHALPGTGHPHAGGDGEADRPVVLALHEIRSQITRNEDVFASLGPATR